MLEKAGHHLCEVMSSELESVLSLAMRVPPTLYVLVSLCSSMIVKQLGPAEGMAAGGFLAAASGLDSSLRLRSYRLLAVRWPSDLPHHKLDLTATQPGFFRAA